MKPNLKFFGVVLTTLFLALSCSDDADDDVNMNEESYETTFKITDAPIDNANVEAVVVTITDVKVDGNSLEGFSATTVDLSALVNGQTETLGKLDLGAKSYSNLELVLDYDTDVNGNAPGCYVEMVNGEKDKLEASSKTIQVNDAFEVFADAQNNVVVDFDLRKSIVENEGDFKFVTMGELSSALRVVNEETTGEIEGTVQDAESGSDKIIVYAYKKGTFNAETETNGSGTSNVTFANAVTSAEVSGINNSYSLNFLEEGEYELIFAGYEEDTNGELEFNALLEVESVTDIDLGALNVTSALQLNVNVVVTGTMQ